MTAWEWTQVDLTCDTLRCGKRFAGERGLPGVRRDRGDGAQAGRPQSGWTLVRMKIGRHNYDRDYCPGHKPEEA